MGRKNKRKNKFKKKFLKEKRPLISFLPEKLKSWILGIFLLLIAIIITLSFFELAGTAGEYLFSGLSWLIGKVVLTFPFILILGSLSFFKPKYKKFSVPVFLGMFIFILGIAGLFHSFFPEDRQGGWLGYLISWPFLKFFGPLVSNIVFAAIIVVGGLIFWHLLHRPKEKDDKKDSEDLPARERVEEPEKRGLIKKIFAPKFKVKDVEPFPEKPVLTEEKEAPIELKSRDLKPSLGVEYQPPPTSLLEPEKGVPTAGDTRVNSTIIKKTLQNFDIPVEMSEVNIGPTVTQYTLKPAEGVKLSKIVGLNNDLALALASHPIRIEAPIPGKSLVGIEMPNKSRAQVRLRELIENQNFQNAPSPLTIVLGKDVSGTPVYADLARMPHLLVAGSTGTGKTVYLNNFVLSLIYKNSPEMLKFIMIDPKRVEFGIYNDLPHLLSPVIFDTNKTVNALKWLILEMERRFDVLSSNGSRDLVSYNTKVLKEKEDPLPYIVLMVDELADLMAAKGREGEAGIVRLAQMSRAVGIHLVVATQRPSVEVITGLIKANITSRVTFQVASQVDSRTVLDAAGAEKLLGLGDMLYLSAELGKPKRIQSAFVSEKEVKKVVNWLDQKKDYPDSKIEIEDELAKELQTGFDIGSADPENVYEGEDPLYEEAKRLVVESKKASASLLQRRLRVGYARAARLLDILEERGVIGPGEGAKPREVYFRGDKEDQDWQKI